jgi:hypothetical protein
MKWLILIIAMIEQGLKVNGVNGAMVNLLQ